MLKLLKDSFICHALAAVAVVSTGLLACVSSTAQAAEVSGVQYADRATFDKQELVLNGAGVRTFLLAKVYVAGLYLPRKMNDRTQVLQGNVPRTILITMLRESDTAQLTNAFLKGVRANSTPEELNKVSMQMLMFGQMFGKVATLQKGDTLRMDYVPGQGLLALHNGKRLGEPMAGEDFARAVAKVWLGDNPADERLKRDMLGVPAVAAGATQ
jgi:Chalcone isomerase-like